MKKIPSRHAGKLFTLFTATLMSFMMSGVVTVSNIGFHLNFFSRWMRAWGFAFMVGYPIICLVVPLVRKIVAKITAEEFARS